MWKVLWFYEKVHNIANFGGCAAILIFFSAAKNSRMKRSVIILRYSNETFS